MSCWFLVKDAPSNNTSQSNGALDRLQQHLGYRFDQLERLTLALTHKSHAAQNNERLEFVGDAVLGYVVANLLFHAYPHQQEDVLSLMRARLVRGANLATIARHIAVADALRLGSGERKSGGRGRDSILADAFEAIIGAVHEDGGIAAASGVIQRLFDAQIAAMDISSLKDAKTQLQEWLQGAGHALPDYQVEAVSGEAHQRRYTVACIVADLSLRGTAEASSRRGAEKMAAAQVLEQIQQGERRD